MSIADYGMFKIAQQNLISARQKVRNLTLWFGRQKRALTQEMSNMRTQHRVLEQQLSQSIFTYSNQLQSSLDMSDPQQQMMAMQMITQRQQNASIYMQQWQEYSNDILERKQREIEEVEAENESELEAAKSDVEYWQQVKKNSKEEYSNGIKDMFGGNG